MTVAQPEGLVYRPELLSEAEERSLLTERRATAAKLAGVASGDLVEALVQRIPKRSDRLGHAALVAMGFGARLDDTLWAEMRDDLVWVPGTRHGSARHGGYVHE